MSYLIYQEQAGEKLKLIAEVGADGPEAAVDTLVDEMPRFGGEDFVVFETESRVEVTAGQPIVRSTRRGGKRTAAAAPRRQSRPRKTEVREEPKAPRRTAAKKTDGRSKAARAAKAKAAAKPAPKPRTAKAKAKPKVAAKPRASKAAPKRPAAAKAKKTGGGSPFKRNAKSDE